MPLGRITPRIFSAFAITFFTISLLSDHWRKRTATNDVHEYNGLFTKSRISSKGYKIEWTHLYRKEEQIPGTMKVTS